MKLKDLLVDIPVIKTNMDLQQQITDVVYDSRKVLPCGLG